VRFRGEIDVQRIDDNWIAVADFDEAELLVREIDDRSGDLAQVADAVGKGVGEVGIGEVGETAASINKACESPPRRCKTRPPGRRR
jgi:hypothetical protein